MSFVYGREAWVSPFITKAAIAIYLAMLIFIIGFGYYIVPYAIFILAFLILVPNVTNLKLFQFLKAKPVAQKLMLIFLIAVILRFSLLTLDQVITRDIEMYVFRAEQMMAGRIPYEDFSINKPPLYAYMLQFLGTTLGANMFSFRAFFSIMDGLVAVLIFYFSMCKFDEEFSFKATFLYAICPLPILAIGLSGHYEPVVMIFVILSLIFLFKSKYNISAILLGLGFALKFFPLVLLPFFVWKVQTWRNRITYIVLFSIPIIISLIPILFISSTAFWAYMYDQTYTWTAKKSFAFVFETLIGSHYVLGIRISLITTITFLGLILLMFIAWVRKRFDVNFWFKLIIFIFVIYYGLYPVASLQFFKKELGLADPIPIMIIFALIYFTIAFLVLSHYLHRLEFQSSKREEMFILSTFALVFLLFSSSQNNPWYILWVLPFLFAIKADKIRLILLWLIVWNFEGLGISLLPGFVLF